VVSPTLVRSGAALGANSTILPGVRIGRWAMIGSGSVVTHDVADYELVVGNPARRVGSACPCGEPLRDALDGTPFSGPCPGCGDQMPPPSGGEGA
jgi:UDP-2-acetamido-3-amino-2,3-dideoxy-glucuronate N-acetyltransferase